jgi:hypothetical protein
MTGKSFLLDQKSVGLFLFGLTCGGGHGTVLCDCVKGMGNKREWERALLKGALPDSLRRTGRHALFDLRRSNDVLTL